MAEGDAHYIEWVKVKESLTKVFEDDLNQLQLEVEKNDYELSDLFNCTLNEIPVIIKLYLGKRINPQSLSILASMHEPIQELGKNTNIELLVGDELRIVYKLHGFLKYNKEKLQKLYKEFIENVSMG